MPSANDIIDHLRRIVEVLDEAGISYMATGALVRNAIAPARTSEDLDVVVDLRERSVESVRERFERAGFKVHGPVKGNLGARLVIDLPEYEADLWLAPDTELHRREMGNAREIVYQGMRLRIMAPEDFVLRKLVNTRVRRNFNDLDDAYHVLLAAWSDIDHKRLIARAEGHRVGERARELVALVREDREKLERGEPLE